MTGYARAEVIGETPRILHGPKTDRAQLDRLRHQLSLEQPFDGETINYRKDGSEYVIEWYIVPLRDTAGKITHWMAIQRDVTERKVLEEQLRYQVLHDPFDRTAQPGPIHGTPRTRLVLSRPETETECRAVRGPGRLQSRKRLPRDTKRVTTCLSRWPSASGPT
jgi:PAS domain S-box-containing protein